jgi:hypothetical protein
VLLLGVLFGALSLQAVGTVVVTTRPLADIRAVKYTLVWTSDASGDVSGNTAALAVIALGDLYQIQFIPNAGGTAPTTLYDVVLNDAAGVDFLAGAGANLSATVSTVVRPASPLLHDGTGTLNLVVSNAGAAKGGTVILWLRR